MTATLWLLAGLIVLLVGVLAILVWVNKVLRAVNEVLDYRTACAADLDSDVRRIQAQVPDAPLRARVRAGDQQPAKE